MRVKDPSIKGGRVIFDMKVEYTGEVISVKVIETTLTSSEFLGKVSDFIMDTDFVGWARDDKVTLQRLKLCWAVIRLLLGQVKAHILLS